MRPGYAQSKKDWKYLHSQAELADQVEEVDWFEGLLENPTKTKALELYHNRIDQWFSERASGYTLGASYAEKPEKLDRRTRGIANRHLIDIEDEQ